MSIAERPGGEAVCLHNVSWETYEALRDEVENRNVRMTYDQGWLQLMSPSKLHERLGALLARLIEVWTEEAGIEVQNCRCMTLRRPEQQRGLESDNCFYIEHEPQVRGRDELDLEVDPPPDLAMEIDLSSSSLGRMSIYATVGVPSVCPKCGAGKTTRLKSIAWIAGAIIAVVRVVWHCRGSHLLKRSVLLPAGDRWEIMASSDRSATSSAKAGS